MRNRITSGNHLIDALPPAESRRLRAACSEHVMVAGTVLHDASTPLRHAYFPIDGLISLLGQVDGHPPMEVGLIGYESMLGATLHLDTPDAPVQALVQGSGSSLRIDSAALRGLARDSAALRRQMDRALHAQITDLARSAACTRFHRIDARLARWLLGSHERARGADLEFTHRFLGDMLGVRRAGVTLAAGRLQARGVIGYARGRIRVLDPGALAKASCSCHVPIVAARA